MKSRFAFAAFALVLSQFSFAQYTVEVLPTPSGRGRAMAAGGGQIIGVALGTGGGPALWDGPGHNLINLTTPGYSGVVLQGVGGGNQVGYGTSGEAHALMWSGSPGSVVDLHPNGYSGSLAYATSGTHQVGSAGVGFNQNHAMLWSGTAQSAVDLHPFEYDLSEARGVWGDVQVGSVLGTKDGQTTGGAAVWRGSAASMQLLPLLLGHSQGGALATHGEQIVGSAVVPGNDGQHALLWSTDGQTVIDLSPEGWGSSAFDTNGIQQVGQAGQTGGNGQAVVWSGSSSSMLNLHEFLPAKFEQSIATGIDENGTIVGWGSVTGLGSVPLVWTPVPEPSSIFVLAVGIGALAIGRRRKR